MSELVCSQCGKPFEKIELDGKMVEFPFPEDWTQDNINFINAVCKDCTPKRMQDIKGDKFDKVEKVANALDRLCWLYRWEYNEDPELEQLLEHAVIVADQFLPHLERIDQLDREKCASIHRMCWPGEDKDESKNNAD